MSFPLGKYSRSSPLILNIDKDLETAYVRKERYIQFNATCRNPEEALKQIHDFYNEFLKSNIEEFTDFISALGNWDTEIANSFIVYKGRRISNGIAESTNSKVSTVIFVSKGIRNSDRRKKRIMYVVNKRCLTL